MLSRRGWLKALLAAPFLPLAKALGMGKKQATITMGGVTVPVKKWELHDKRIQTGRYIQTVPGTPYPNCMADVGFPVPTGHLHDLSTRCCVSCPECGKWWFEDERTPEGLLVPCSECRGTTTTATFNTSQVEPTPTRDEVADALRRLTYYGIP